MEARDTHDLGRFYWHTDTRKKSWKPAQISRSQMVNTPFRRGLGVFLSLPRLRHGIVFGWWGRKNMFTVSDILSPLPSHRLPGVRVIGDRTEEVRGWPNKHDYDRNWDRLAQIERDVRDELL